MTGQWNIWRALLISGVLSACTVDTAGERFLNPEQLRQRTAFLQEVLDQMDLNEDGIVTCFDSGIFRGRRFDSVDDDGNGELTMAELREAEWFNVAFLEDRFDHYDLDNSRLVERDEFINRANPDFDVIDANLDCIITLEELSASRPVRGMQRGEFVMRRRVPG